MDQQLHLPESDEVSYPIPYEFEAKTMPVPRGQFSVLSELEEGNLTSAEAMLYLFMNHGSTWVSGESWCLSTKYLSKLGGMSRRYVRDILKSLIEKGWIETLSTSNPAGNRYLLKHHLCEPDEVPVDFDGKPLKFAVPCGDGGPIERCIAGDIPWKAALVWIVLKRHSEWRAGRDNTGHTWPLKLHTLSKNCRMNLKSLQDMLKILEEQGMLRRITPKSRSAVFQLYPKPYPRAHHRASDTPPSSPSPPSPSPNTLQFDGEGFMNDTYFYSKNKKYRCKREVGTTFDNIERRVQGRWKKVSDFHRSQQMNPKIIEYFEKRFGEQGEYESTPLRDGDESESVYFEGESGLNTY